MRGLGEVCVLAAVVHAYIEVVDMARTAVGLTVTAALAWAG